MTRIISVSMALAALCIAAPALAQPATPSAACLQIGQVYDFKPVPGNRSLIVTDRFRRKYKLTFMGVCRDLQFNLGLAFKSFGTGQLSCIARGDQVISRQAVGMADHCIINKIEAYTPAMEQADAAAAAAAKAAKSR
jgi:hypothetical protein